MNLQQYRTQFVKKKMPTRPRHQPGVMNKTEGLYAKKLDMERIAGSIIEYKFEPVKLKLAPNTFLTMDFMVVKPDCVELHEVKGGFIEDDAMVKFKVAAEIYWWWKFVLIQYKGGAWKTLLEI